MIWWPAEMMQVRQHGKRKVLAILDVYGFENVSNNSFEQLTTNYCNEKLHQLITEVVLKEEQEEYMVEGLEWNQITYMDNTIVCDLLEKVPDASSLPDRITLVDNFALTIAESARDFRRAGRRVSAPRCGHRRHLPLETQPRIPRPHLLWSAGYLSATG